jgi:hypothetical protein
VTEIGISYLRLDTVNGPMSLPNAQVLAAAVGRPGKPASTAAQPRTPASPGHAEPRERTPQGLAAGRRCPAGPRSPQVPASAG